MTTNGASRSKLAIFIGRFQPFHLGHAQIVDAALAQCDRLVILIGSAFKARSTYNPFTFEERKAIISAALRPEHVDCVLILPLRDSEYNDDQWKLNVQKGVEEASHHFFGRSSVPTSLVGHSKDHSSFYLKMFPQFSAVEVPNYKLLSATPLRENYFINAGLAPELASVYLDTGIFAPSTIEFLKQFERSTVFEQMVREFRYIEEYKKPYADLPYPPVFVTSDIVVVQSGHVLMIRRRAEPGRGLWAIPGGFVKSTQTIEQAAYAELQEETGLTRKTVGKYEKVRVFDEPNRSARGRVITHAHLFRLPDSAKFPRLKAGDDADKARWVPITEIASDECFEDHAAIIHSMTETYKF